MGEAEVYGWDGKMFEKPERLLRRSKKPTAFLRVICLAGGWGWLGGFIVSIQLIRGR